MIVIERENERIFDLPPVHSADGHSSQGRASQATARSSVWISRVGGGARALGHLLLPFPGHEQGAGTSCAELSCCSPCGQSWMWVGCVSFSYVFNPVLKNLPKLSSSYSYFLKEQFLDWIHPGPFCCLKSLVAAAFLDPKEHPGHLLCSGFLLPCTT